MQPLSSESRNSANLEYPDRSPSQPCVNITFKCSAFFVGWKPTTSLPSPLAVPISQTVPVSGSSSSLIGTVISTFKSVYSLCFGSNLQAQMRSFGGNAYASTSKSKSESCVDCSFQLKRGSQAAGFLRWSFGGRKGSLPSRGERNSCPAEVIMSSIVAMMPS